MPTTNPRGFTLVEAMLASALLAMAVVAFCGAMAAATQGTRYGDQRRRVESAARENMEFLAGSSLAGLPIPAGSAATVSLPASALLRPESGAVRTTATLTFLQRSAKQANRSVALLTVESRENDEAVASLRRLITTAEMSK
jgi:prepilin-type N-terminal cleavage/methylation domain-containing protein